MKKLELILLILAVITLITNSLIQTLILSQTNISGFATEGGGNTAAGSVGFCVAIPSTEDLIQNFSLGGFNGVLGGVVNISTEIINYLPGEVASHQFTLFRRDTNELEIINSTKENDSKYYTLFDTKKYPDKNCYYKMSSVVLSYRSSCLSRYWNESGFFSINNINEPPKWDQFRNENTTDFDSYSNWTNLSNVVLFKPGVGIIDFGDYGLNFDQADLDSKITFTDKYLKIEEKDFYCIAYSMKKVTFFNVSFILPILLYNGQDCTSLEDIYCEIIDYNKTSKTFTVEIFSPGEYKVEEGLSGSVSLKIYTYRDGAESKEIYYQEPIFFRANYSLPMYFTDFENMSCSLIVKNEDKSKIVFASNMSLNATNPGSNLSSATFISNITDSYLPIGLYHTELSCGPKEGSEYTWNPKKLFRDFEIKRIRISERYWSDTEPILLYDLTRNENTTLLEEDAKKYSINIYFDDDNKKTLYNNNLSSVYIAIYKYTSSNDTILTQGNTIKRFVCNISWGDDTVETKVLNESLQEIPVLEHENESIKNIFKINISRLTHKYEWPGTYITQIHCYDPEWIYWDFYDQRKITITNRKPVLAYKIPDVTWYKDSVYSPYRLNDYFYDPDGENLTYAALEVPEIGIYISNDSLVTLMPEKGFVGSRITFFTAIDNFGASTNSNLVNLTVVGEEKVEYKEYEEEESLPGEPPLAPLCQEQWNCSEWGKCMPSGIQIRKCYDVNNCNTTFNKPIEWRTCVYTPTCDDGLKNQNETGVDCGGPCPPCPSCNNGYQDWNEEGIDCGGYCSPCPTCYDGIQNQGEEGIDCGGPCPPCKEEQRPGVIQAAIINHLNEIIVISALLIVTLSFISLLFKRVSSFNRFVVKIINKIISSLSIPSFIEHNIYSELIFKVNRLERFAMRGKLSVVLERTNEIFKEVIKDLLSVEEEKSYDELAELVSHLHLNEVDKLLLQYLSLELEKAKYSNQKNPSRKKLISLIRKIKMLIERNKHILLEVQLNKEIESLQEDIEKSSKSEIIEKRVLLSLLRELLLINEKIEQKKLRDAIRIYKNIKVLYSKLNFWNRIKVYNRVYEAVLRLQQLIQEFKKVNQKIKAISENQKEISAPKISKGSDLFNKAFKEKFKLKRICEKIKQVFKKNK